MSKRILEINNLCKNYSKFSLSNINLTLEEGKVLGLIGQNGAGKSTTIKSLLGLISYDSGSILINNQVMTPDNINLKQDIGYVPENVFLYQDVKCREFYKFVKSCYKNWDDDLFFELSKEFDLNLDKRIKELSKGNLVKLLIIIAISHHPRLLVLDEPTSGLDPLIRNQVLDYLKKVVEKEKCSILFSSHITEDINKLADTVSFLHNGKILLSESKETILKKYKKVVFKNEIPNNIRESSKFVCNNVIMKCDDNDIVDMNFNQEEYCVSDITLDEVLGFLVNNEKKLNP
ncbi:MAG: ABC transporter ATP-binding protein [Clostridia bacterium]|nr:ABC transporter ATP-binding protein [Clostridia bacterium]